MAAFTSGNTDAVSPCLHKLIASSIVVGSPGMYCRMLVIRLWGVKHFCKPKNDLPNAVGRYGLVGGLWTCGCSGTGVHDSVPVLDNEGPEWGGKLTVLLIKGRPSAVTRSPQGGTPGAGTKGAESVGRGAVIRVYPTYWYFA